MPVSIKFINTLDRPWPSYYTNCKIILTILHTRRSRIVLNVKYLHSGNGNYGFEFGKESYQNND